MPSRGTSLHLKRPRRAPDRSRESVQKAGGGCRVSIDRDDPAVGIGGVSQGDVDAGVWQFAARTVRPLDQHHRRYERVAKADVVEIAPAFDPTNITAQAGAQVLFTLACLAVEARKRRRA